MAILLIRRTARPVDDAKPARWRRGEVVQVWEDDHVLGGREHPNHGAFAVIRVPAATVEQAKYLQQTWKHKISWELLGSQGLTRRIKISSDQVAPGGRGAFARTQVENFLIYVGGTYVTHTNNSFTFDIVATVAERAEILAAMKKYLAQLNIRRRRFRISETGMALLNNNNNDVTVTPAQLQPYVIDRRTQ